ncbi:uncharacterized protein LOC128226620 [Mya arenaria]|uniref:uncharacterized protein LOC128226620 n=1 Tax=Mya arenaria TaxID=6604 RepID=UPI0022E6C624|nr:uncharacterized protein LOC128226620 [Mya arenaria]
MDHFQSAFILLIFQSLAGKTWFCFASQTCKTNDIKTAVLLNRETQTDLKEHKMEMDQRLNDLQQALTDMSGKLKKTEEELLHQKRTLAATRVQLADVETNLTDTTTEAAELRMKMIENEQELAWLKDQQANSSAVTTSGGPPVYFLVHSPLSLTYKSGEIVRYGTILYSHGGNYSSTTGKYTVPHTGLYAFSHQVCSNSNAHHYFSIMKEGQSILPTEVFNAADHPTCSSASAYVYVQLNETVWIESIYAGYPMNIVSHNSYYRTSFSGALVHRYA